MSNQDFFYKSRRAQFYERFFQDRLAVAGLIAIVLLHILAAGCYLIAPDATPNANDGAIQVRKQPPGFSVKMLKIMKNQPVEQNTFFERFLKGRESKYTIVPIKEELHIEGDSVLFKPFGREQTQLSYLLLNCVKPLSVNAADYLGKGLGVSWRAHNDTLTYIDCFGEAQRISRESLQASFMQDHLETRTYWLGTDKSGRDMLSRLILGARISLAMGFVAMLISTLVGVFLGAIAAYFGHKVDLAVQWLMTVFWSVPGTMLVIVLAVLIGSKSHWALFTSVGFTLWVEVARITRGQIMAVQHRLFVDAARSMGYNRWWILLKHVLPNSAGPIATVALYNFALAILIEAGLSFLGMGIQPPVPSWGTMLNEGFQSVGTINSWHLIFMPSAAIIVTILSFNLVANGLKKAINPLSSFVGTF